jgi:hypothetical protein
MPRLASLVAFIAAFGCGALSAHAHDAPEQPGQRLVQGHPPECVCRAQGRTFTVGESACLRTPAGARVAFCGMVLNNTSWHFTERSCPES